MADDTSTLLDRHIHCTLPKQKAQDSNSTREREGERESGDAAACDLAPVGALPHEVQERGKERESVGMLLHAISGPGGGSPT